MFLSDMLSVIVVCFPLSHIHICSLVCVLRMRMSNCWSLYILCVPYALRLLSYLTVQHTLIHTHTHNPNGIYKLKCNTCNGVYVGQSGGTINVKYKEHIRCIRMNNSTSTYEAHILMNRREYWTKENTLQLLKACQKGTRMNCWEALYIQIFHHKKY